MKPNPKKFQFMIVGKGSRLPAKLNINKIKIRESQKVMLLGFTVDNCLTFKDHIDTLYRDASYKLHALIIWSFILSSFDDLLLHSNEVPIHQKQLRQLTTEICKRLTDLSPEFIKAVFTAKELPYNLRNGHMLNLPSAQTMYYGTNSIFFRARQVWNDLPLSIKQSQPLLEFKTNIKTLKNIECLCTICKI